MIILDKNLRIFDFEQDEDGCKYKVKTKFERNSVGLTVGDQQTDPTHAQPVGCSIGAGSPVNVCVSDCDT